MNSDTLRTCVSITCQRASFCALFALYSLTEELCGAPALRRANRTSWDVIIILKNVCRTGQWRTEGGGFGVFKPSPSKFRRPSKIVPNSTRLWKLLKIAEFRKQTPQDIPKKDSKILKLPPVRNCFTLVVTNKLVVIMNSLKVPKVKKILLYEIKFLVPNYSCLQNPWLGGYCPQIPILSVLNWICWTPPPEQYSWVRHWNRIVFSWGWRHRTLSIVKGTQHFFSRLAIMYQEPEWSHFT